MTVIRPARRSLVCIAILFAGLAAGPQGQIHESDFDVPPLSNENTKSGCYAMSVLFDSDEGTHVTTRFIDWIPDHSVVLQMDNFQSPQMALIDEVMFEIGEHQID